MFLWSRTDDEACHCRRYAKKEMVSKLEKAGFEIIRSTGFVSFLLPAMYLLRKGKGGKNADSGLQLPKLLNILLQALMAIERFFIKCGINFPFGGSLLVVFRKKSVFR